MGIFNRRRNNEVQQTSSTTAERSAAGTDSSSSANGDDTQLKTDSGLHTLVELMRAEGSGHLTLELKQSGNDMSLSFFENGREQESLVVVPGNKWFDGVARLYTDEEKSLRGAWSRALIVLEDSAAASPQVQVSYLNTETQTTSNLTYQLGESAVDSEPEATAFRAAGEEESTDTEEETSALGNRFDRIGARLNQTESSEENAKPEQTFADIAFARADSNDNAEPTSETIEEPDQEPDHRPEQISETDLADTPESAETGEESAAYTQENDRSLPTEQTETAEAAEETIEEIPSHIDDDFDNLPETDEKTISATTIETDAPESTLVYDISPSYHETEEALAKPSTTAKAEGNLVLTEAEVVARLAKAQEALFGENGSARNVSTVLIRIRSLGSYYDALTHVRADGFWDQKKTFELVPEDVLKVLELKADSYLEGYGSPLAISLRFTPGIPPVAQFDYSNEEAFVKYSDQLPAQQYMEELRMFPRTGANIPEHINQALTSWTF